MKIRWPSYYKEFVCIASECEYTCCTGWDVVIDSGTYQCYQDMEGAFGEKLRSKMVVDQDGDNIFVLDGDRCPFLNSNNNLCDIHKEKGEQYLSYTCRQYPRYMEEFVDLREIGISLSCPEAARIILGNSKVTEFELSEDSQVSDTPHEDEDVLEDFFQCRATIINVLEMSDIPLGVRVAIILRFVQELQDKIDFNEMDAIKQVREKYDKRTYIEELRKALSTYKGNEVTKYNDVYEYFKTYRALEHINAEDQLGLNKVLRTYWNSEVDSGLYTDKHRTFNDYYKNNMINFKKVFAYYIYRYFMKSFFDYDMSSKIKVAIMSTIMIKELAVVRWIENGAFSEADMVDISSKYSRDIEHLEENIETLEKNFETEEVYVVDRIINTLLNEF